MHKLWDRLESLVDLGLTKGIGFSNANTQLTCDVMTYARHMPIYNQVQLNPYHSQEDAVKFMKAHEIEPVAASPVGRSAAKMGPKHSSDLLADPVLAKIGSEIGKTPAQVALAWNLQRGVTVIPKAASPQH